MAILDLHPRWKPSLDLLLGNLRVPRRKRIDFSAFPPGLDGARIDVWVGDSLVKAIDELVEASLSRRAHSLNPGGALSTLRGDVSDAFREIYGVASLMNARRARKAMRRDLYQLFQLSVVKQILLTVDHKVAQWCAGAEAGMERAGHSRQERMWQMQLCQDRLRYQVAQDVLTLMRMLDRAGRKRRKSLLGLSWPVAEELIYNPLLQLDGLGTKEHFLEIYPLVLLDPVQFRKVEAVILDVLDEWLPSKCIKLPPPPDQTDYRQLSIREDRGELRGYARVEAFLRRVMDEEEYTQDCVHWLDEPANLPRLLDSHYKGGCGAWCHPRWPEFQSRLASRIEAGLQEADVLEPLIASVRLKELYSELGRRGAPDLLLDYLLGRRSLSGVVMALEKQEKLPNPSAYQARLLQASKALQQAGGAQRRRWLVRALEGHFTLRRDLKLAWVGYRAMNEIALLQSDPDLELSRSNGLLQDLGIEGRKSDAIIGHVIIKADLRGSTALIASMNQAGINPATYFSRNLFNPVNTLIKAYGAEKLFLEGDAAILAFLDRESAPAAVVARACALAQELIALLERRNRQNERRGLPRLEVGVGIAYEKGPPTYLFDEGHKITISPAIHRADRLSSCNLPSAFLEKLDSQRAGRAVEVVRFAETANLIAKTGELRRYNVNGVELDEAAFRRLRQEIVLRTVSAEALVGMPEGRYYVGRFTAKEGKTRWLVVREAIVQRWNGERFVADSDGRLRFHEVITDPGLIKQIRRHLKGSS